MFIIKQYHWLFGYLSVETCITGRTHLTTQTCTVSHPLLKRGSSSCHRMCTYSCLSDWWSFPQVRVKSLMSRRARRNSSMVSIVTCTNNPSEKKRVPLWMSVWTHTVHTYAHKYVYSEPVAQFTGCEMKPSLCSSAILKPTRVKFKIAAKCRWDRVKIETKS